MSSLYSLLPYSSLQWLFLRKFQVSGFPSCLFCSASAFHGYCFHCFLCFSHRCPLLLACWAPLTRVPVLVFACQLLRCFFATCRCPVLAIGVTFFVSFFIFSVFLVYPSFVFSVRVSLPATLLFLHPLSDRLLLLWGFTVFLAVHLLRSAFFFFFSFVFIGLACDVSLLAFFPLAAYVA